MAPMTGKQTAGKNRNREERIIENFLTGEEAWKRSVEKIIAEIEEMRKEMKEELVRIKEQMQEDRKVREKKRRKEREEWKEERRVLEKRIAELEWVNERKERMERTNNIVIRKVNWGTERLEQEVEGFVKEDLKVKVAVKKASRLRTSGKESVIIAEIENWEEKREIMRRKKELKRGIFIEDDLTKKEREIQYKLRGIAKEERQKGVKDVRDKKIYLKERWHRWNEKKE